MIRNNDDSDRRCSTAQHSTGTAQHSRADTHAARSVYSSARSRSPHQCNGMRALDEGRDLGPEARRERDRLLGVRQRREEAVGPDTSGHGPVLLRVDVEVDLCPLHLLQWNAKPGLHLDGEPTDTARPDTHTHTYTASASQQAVSAADRGRGGGHRTSSTAAARNNSTRILHQRIRK